MKEKEIERYLAELGEELEDLSLERPVRMLVVGGVFMITQIGNRRTTEDIDVLLLDVDIERNSPLYMAFRVAARKVAARNKLTGSWINDVVSNFLLDLGNVPQGEYWRTYGKLELYFPPPDYILMLKLLANRGKDKRDIEVLCQQLNIHTREQAQSLIDRYVPDKVEQEMNDVDKKLNKIFKVPKE